MTLTQVIGGLSTSPDTAFALARIGRERELAASRDLRDRDMKILGQTMTRLDARRPKLRPPQTRLSRRRLSNGSEICRPYGRLPTTQDGAS